MQEASSRPWPIGWVAVTWVVMSQPLRRFLWLPLFLEKKKERKEKEKKERKKDKERERGKKKKKGWLLFVGLASARGPEAELKAGGEGVAGAVVWILWETPF